MSRSAASSRRLHAFVVATIACIGGPCALRAHAGGGALETGAGEGAAAAERAQALYLEALELYKRSDFDAASQRLSESHALAPRNDTLFAWAQSERMEGRCSHANVLFARFIASEPGERQVEAARLAMRRCVPIAPRTPPPLAQRPLERNAPPFYRDAVGDVLAVAGVMAAATGLALIVSAHGEAGAAEGATTLAEAQSMRARAESRWAWGMGVAALGVGLAAGATLRFVAVSRSSSEGITLALGGRF